MDLSAKELILRGALLFFGFLMCLGSLWGGSYLVVVIYPHGHWANFASFFTAVFSFVLGAALVAAATSF